MQKIIFEPSGSEQAFTRHLETLDREYGSILILACDANTYLKEVIDPLLKQCNSTIIGAVFPSIIYEGVKYSEGVLFVVFEETMCINTINAISSKDYESLDADMEQQIEGFDESVKTMFVFVDGLAKNIGECINVLFDNYGLDVNYIGGGSGSLSFIQKPSLFTNQGFIEDALVYAYSTRKSAIGVSHGWRSINGPYQVTKAQGTVVKELDFKPAFQVYKSIIDHHSDTIINADNFFEIAKSFPFGINTISGEKIVRDPIVLNGTDMVCVGNVEEGSYVDILRGNSDELIKAAQQALRLSRSQMDFEGEFMFFVDCISRVLFLEQRFDDEINAVYDSSIPMIGALSLGEIANNGRDYLEFYNKTSVVGHIGNA
jgi:hypothetical protein